MGVRVRKIEVAKATSHMQGWKDQVIESVMVGVRISTEKAFQSAVEDAPVRDVFKHGSAHRRKGLRTRTLTPDEAASESAIRRQLGLAEAVPGFTRTRGKVARDAPYSRRAAVRRGNPNAFAPFVTKKAVVLSAEDREFIQELKEGRTTARGGTGLPEGFEDEHPEVRGGRELTRTGRLRHRPATNRLHARGRYDLATKRANFTKDGVTTLGGTLRRSIRKLGPHRVGRAIKGRIISPVPYSKYQEFGTCHNRATPYMRPAILKLQTSYRREIVKAINRANR